MIETTVLGEEGGDTIAAMPSLQLAVSETGETAMLSVAGIGAPGIDNDIILVRRCKKGDTEAYRQLVLRHERRVMSILTRIMFGQRAAGPCHSMSDVEDLAQEVFVQAWRGLPSFRGEAQFSTWLYRIATNRALKEWRRTKRVPGQGWIDGELDDERASEIMSLAEPHAAESDPESVVQRSARDEQIKGAIETLPEKQRAVILLHYYEDYACEDIARILECSVGTVWSRLHYACKRLRDQLCLAESVSV